MRNVTHGVTISELAEILPKMFPADMDMQGKEADSAVSIEPDPQLMALIENSPVASVISNPRLPDNPITAVNDRFIELTGYDREEIVGRNCRFRSGPGTESWLTEEIRRGVREKTPVLVELLNYKRDGTPVPQRGAHCTDLQSRRRARLFPGLTSGDPGRRGQYLDDPADGRGRGREGPVGTSASGAPTCREGPAQQTDRT